MNLRYKTKYLTHYRVYWINKNILNYMVYSNRTPFGLFNKGLYFLWRWDREITNQNSGLKIKSAWT